MDWVLFGFFKAMIALGHTKETLTVIGFIRSPSDEETWNKAVFSAALDVSSAQGYYGAEIGVAASLPPELLEHILRVE